MYAYVCVLLCRDRQTDSHTVHESKTDRGPLVGALVLPVLGEVGDEEGGGAALAEEHGEDLLLEEE